MTAAAPAVLIVEDERLVARDLQRALNDIGYDAFAIARSGAEALARVAERVPDIVIMDVRIEGPLDGIQTGALLKNEADIPIVYLTAHSDDPSLERAKRTEPHGYLVKPVKIENLHSTLSIALNKHALDTTRERLRSTERRMREMRERLTADLEQARTDLAAILNNLPAGVTSWRTDLVNRFANPTAGRQFQIPADIAPGMHLRNVIGDHRFHSAEPHVKQALAGRRSSAERMDVEPNGTAHYWQVDYIPEIKDGAVVGFYTLENDITEMRRSYSRVRDLALHLETVREEERSAAAAALHEGIAQELFAMKLGVEHLESQARNRRGLHDTCQELKRAIDKCMEDTRQVAYDLRPASLHHLDVSTAIMGYAAHFGPRHGLDIKLDVARPFPELDEALRLLFFRAAQEALANVARHARAVNVLILFRLEPGAATMHIDDDGVGIEAAAMDKPRAMGVWGMRERFVACGGALAVERRHPVGTRFSVTLPIDRK